MTSIDFTSEALRYAELGWKVFPLAAGSKVPAVKGGAGVKDATDRAGAIREWGERYRQANIGVACGEASGVVVIRRGPKERRR